MEDDVLIFTPEDLALLLKTPESKHYIYYEKKTGTILSVSNELLSNYEYFIEIESSLAQFFLDGVYKLSDYAIGYDGESSGLTVVKKEDQEFTRKTNLFEKVTTSDNLEDKEFIVEWNKEEACWNFWVNKKFKDRLYEIGVARSLVIFVSTNLDLDVLIRSMYIDTELLLNSNKISIPFENYIEADIDKLVVSSKSVFNTYGLKITNE